jgi:hypothetical protein
MSLPPSLPAKSRWGVSTRDSWKAEKQGKWSTRGRNVTRPFTNRLISEICDKRMILGYFLQGADGEKSRW